MRPPSAVKYASPLTYQLAGTVLGIMLLVTFVISIFAVAQRNHVTSGLVFLNWTLIGDSIAVLVIGTFIWFYSLRQRNNYFEVFQAQTPAVRQAIQDKVRRSQRWTPIYPC